MLDGFPNYCRRAPAGAGRMLGQQADGMIQIGSFKYHDPADLLFGFGERAVGHKKPCRCAISMWQHFGLPAGPLRLHSDHSAEAHHRSQNTSP